MGKLPNSQYIEKYWGGALVSNFRQHVSWFSFWVLIQNYDTHDKVLENTFYLKEKKENKKRRNHRKDKVLQICCNLRESTER